MTQQTNLKQDIEDTMADLEKLSLAARKKIEAETTMVMKRILELREQVKK